MPQPRLPLPELRRLMLDMYHLYPPATIAEMTGRSVGAIRTMACAMGLRSVGRGRNHDPYFTPAQVAKIRNEYGRIPVVHIARELNRTPAAICQKARRLGLGRTRFKLWHAKEDAFLRIHYPKRGTKWVAEQLRRTRNAVKHRARSLGIRRDNESYKASHPWGPGNR